MLTPSVIDEIEGTEGPGAGVDCVTVVMALPCVVVTKPVAAVLEAASVLLAPSAPSSVCWVAVPSPVSMLQVAVVAVLVVPVSWVSQGGLEQTL